MDLIADRGRRVSVEELNTTRLLANARKQANRRNLEVGIDFAFRQRLIPRRYIVNELFDDVTRTLDA